jgi:hypothetical protein
LTFTVVTLPAHGTLSGTAPNLKYTPAAGYFGPDAFSYTANDGTVSSATAKVSVIVTQATSCVSTPPKLDAVVSSDQKTAANKLVSGTLSTSTGDELLLAFISADGPNTPSQKIKSLTGGGLTWSLVSRANEANGTTEVWQSRAASPLLGLKLTATLNNAGYDGSITLAAFTGAGKIAATAKGAGVAGAPGVTIKPTQANSLIWAVGHDWTTLRTVTPLAGQSMVHVFRDTRVQDMFWTQSQTKPTVGTGPIAVGATGFTKDRWTMVAVEIPSVCK